MRLLPPTMEEGSPASCALSIAISFLRASTFPEVKVLTVTLLRTDLARCANFSVPRVSLNASADGEMLAIKTVLEFPPNESRRRNECTISISHKFPLLSLPLDKEFMTDPKVG